MPVQLNKDSEKFAMKLIRAGNISNAAWSFSAADGNVILGDDEDWGAYEKYHLAKDTGFEKETKAYYKYPFGKRNKVYMAALRAIRVRASQQNVISVFDAAGRLLDAAKKKQEDQERSMKKTDKTDKLEIRSCGEIRETQDEGVVEAYLTKWDSVDSYKSTFRRGSFKKTFQERGGKIRLIWNHEELAGKVLEAREDDYGPFVRVKFNLETRSGKEAFSHVKHGDVDSFSFGFNVIKDGWKDGIREITEVRCMECGPVIFEANSQAKIVDVRADNFDQTVYERDLRERGWNLRHALSCTLDDIIWKNNEVISKTDQAISDFHGQYLEWLQEVFNFSDNQDEIRKISSKNDLSYTVRSELDIEDTVKTTSLTESELNKLSKGKILDIESRSKLVELPENIQNAHRLERRKAVESLCDEIRQGGFTDGERVRFESLLSISNQNNKDAVSETIDFVKNIRKNINLK